MATRYEVRTFGDIVRAVLETLKVQASDTESVNRIKRNINLVYLNEVVPASNSWNWLNKTATVSVHPYFDGGSANVQQNVTRVELTQSPSISMEGRFFSVDNSNELYRISTHAANTNFFYLESPYNGTTNTAARYKIWTDKVILPSDCMKVKNVITTNAIKPLDPVSLQQFRKHEVAGGALIGSPSFYAEGDMEEPAPYADIAGLPAIVSTESQGLLKTITFAANIDSYISKGDRLHISHTGQYTYTGDFIANNVSGAVLTYTGRIAYDENTNTTVTGLTVQRINTQNTDPAPTLLVYPAIQQRNQRINLVVDYQAYPSELISDRDEPLIPREHRQVLFFGAMWLSSDRETDLDRADRYKVLMDSALQKMLTRSSATPKTPTMRVSPSYLQTKRGMFGRARYSAEIGLDGFGTGGGSSGNAPTATGTPNTVAVFDENGYLIGSSDINLNLLEYLLGTQAADSQVVADNATTLIDSFDVTTYKNANIQYLVKRGSSYRGGMFMITTDGSTTRISDYPTTEIGDTGTDFSSDLSAGTFRFKATTNSQGVSATVYYKVSLL